MRLLLDTHALLWFLAGDPRLRSEAAAAIADPNNDVYVSVASIWEIVVKSRIGKLSARLDEILGALGPSRIRMLGLEPAHFAELERLAVLPDHRDPFDHLLIAQAIAENLTFVSNDSNVTRYPVAVIGC